MNKLGGYLMLGFVTLLSVVLFFNLAIPVFLSPDYFPWSIVTALALGSLIVFGADKKIKAAEFKKNQPEDDRSQS